MTTTFENGAHRESRAKGAGRRLLRVVKGIGSAIFGSGYDTHDADYRRRSRQDTDAFYQKWEKQLQEARQLKGDYTRLAGRTLTRLTPNQQPGQRYVKAAVVDAFGPRGVILEDHTQFDGTSWPVDPSVPRTTIYDRVFKDGRPIVREQVFSAGLTGDLEVRTRLGCFVGQDEFVSQTLPDIGGADRGQLEMLQGVYTQLEQQYARGAGQPVA